SFLPMGFLALEDRRWRTLDCYFGNSSGKFMAPSPDRTRIARTFSRNGWFSRCPARLREALVAHAQVTTVEAGRWIYDTGDEAHGLYGVLSGSVTTHVVLDNGE